MKITKQILRNLSIISLLAGSSFAQTKGNLIKVEISVDNSMREMGPMKNFSGIIINPDGSQFSSTKSKPNPTLELEKYSETEVNEILEDISLTLKERLELEIIQTPKSKVETSVAGKFSKIGATAINNAAAPNAYTILPYFPQQKVKKIKDKTATEYYDISIKFISGGSGSPLVVMNKEKKAAFLKYRVKTKIVAFDKSGKKIWTKESTSNDFSASVDGTVEKSNYKIINTQTLSLELMKKSFLIALENTLTN